MSKDTSKHTKPMKLKSSEHGGVTASVLTKQKKKKKKQLALPAKPKKLTDILKDLELRRSSTTCAKKEQPNTLTTALRDDAKHEQSGNCTDSKASDTVKQPTEKATFLDLHPWPFEKTFKGTIRRREWNGLVKSIQDAVDCESAHENDNLHAEIASLLDERDALLARINEMREFVMKRNREFEATFN